MAKYKPVKIIFDIEDEYQLKLYEHIKARTNGSAYMRMLIHQDINSDGPATTVNSNDSLVRHSPPLPVNNNKAIIKDDIDIDDLI